MATKFDTSAIVRNVQYVKQKLAFRRKLRLAGIVSI